MALDLDDMPVETALALRPGDSAVTAPARDVRSQAQAEKAGGGSSDIFRQFGFREGDIHRIASLPLSVFLAHFPPGMPPARLFEERETYLSGLPIHGHFGYREFIKYYRLAQHLRVGHGALLSGGEDGAARRTISAVLEAGLISTVASDAGTVIEEQPLRHVFRLGDSFLETESCEYRLADRATHIYEYNTLRLGGGSVRFAAGGVPDGFVVLGNDGSEASERVSYAVLDAEAGARADALADVVAVPVRMRDFAYYRALLARLERLAAEEEARGAGKPPTPASVFFGDTEEGAGSGRSASDAAVPTSSLPGRAIHHGDLSWGATPASLRSVIEVSHPGGSRENVFEFPHGRAKITFLHDADGRIRDARVFSMEFLYPAARLARDWERRVSARLSDAIAPAGGAEAGTLSDEALTEAKRAVVKAARDLITYEKARDLLPRDSSERRAVAEAIAHLVGDITERYGAVLKDPQ